MEALQRALAPFAKAAVSGEPTFRTDIDGEGWAVCKVGGFRLFPSHFRAALAALREGTMREGTVSMESVADELLKASEAARAARIAAIPDEPAAIKALFQAYLRLQELGWRDARYAPRDGSTFDVIEVGSTGIHQCTRDRQGRFWIYDGETWPARPSLFRLAGMGEPDTEAPHA
ncbi:MAG TPA: hypothetical protein VIB55_04285 [Longimicrobium sp.]